MDDGASPLRIGFKVVVVWLSVALFVVSLTALFLSMRAVMDVGGMCAEGGPYEIATSCPKGAVWMTPVSIWVGLLACGLYVFAGRGLPGPKWIALAWPALFISLGWNFWSYGLNPPDGSDGAVVGWIVCGVLFVGMGAVPLIVVLATAPGRKLVFWSDAAPAGGRSTVRQAREAVSSIDWRNLGVNVDDAAADGDDDGTVDRLERLSAMYRRGELTPEEFQRAKSQLLGDA